MNNEPVAWMVQYKGKHDFTFYKPVSHDDAVVIPLYTHPVKKLHLSLQKSKETGELLAVTYTDDEHRIVEVLWQKPLVKELTDEEIKAVYGEYFDVENCDWLHLECIRAILRKAQEK